jgi:hypothetical protein
MLKSKNFFAILLVASLIAVAVAKITNRYHSRPEVFKNSIGIPFYSVKTNNEQLHKLYKNSAIKFSKEESKSHYGRALSLPRPDEFYVSQDDLTIVDFAEFISATNYTPDYFFSSPNPSETKDSTPIISQQDAQVLANWLMNKERVNYQIIASDELERACRVSVEKIYFSFPLSIGSDSFEMLCNTSHAVTGDVDGFANGFRLIRDVN